MPPFAGLIEYSATAAAPSTLAMLQGLVANQGDGWTWTLEELGRYSSAARREAEPPGASRRPATSGSWH